MRSAKTRSTLLWAAIASLFTATCFAQTGDLVIEVLDKKSKEQVAARMHLKDGKGKPVKPAKSVYWHDHFVFDGGGEAHALTHVVE